MSTYHPLPPDDDPRWTDAWADCFSVNVRSVPRVEGNEPLTMIVQDEPFQIIPDPAAWKGEWAPVKAHNQRGWSTTNVLQWRTTAEAVPPIPEDADVCLRVPFMSQFSAQGSNCGPACVAMVANYARPDAAIALHEAVAMTGSDGDYTSFDQLETAFQAAAIPVDPHSGITPALLRTQLQRRQPVIVLVERGKLNPPWHDFRGSHFVVVVGYGPGYFLIHDPMGDGRRTGWFWKIPEDAMIEAMQAKRGQGILVIAPAQTATDWRACFNDHELQEIELARVYTQNFGHGTPGHLSYVVIAKLAQLLDANESSAALRGAPLRA